MINLRVATIDDVLLLCELNADVHRLHYEARPDLFKPPSSDAAMQAFYADIFASADNTVYVAEVDGVAAGYVYCKHIKRADSAFTYTQDVILIDQISVKPIFRKQGCGEALIQAAFDLARSKNISRVMLDTWDFNLNAQEFFKKQGFKTFRYQMDINL